MKSAVRALALVLALPLTLPAGCASTPVVEAAALAPDAIVLDVRNQDEWDAGHLERARLLPLPQLSQRLGDVDKLTGGDKHRTVIVVCRTGRRAGEAKKILEAAGYTHVINAGAWQSLLPPATD